MSRRRKRPVEHEYFMLRWLHAGIHHINKLVMVLVAGLFCLGVYGLCLPEEENLKELQSELEDREEEALLIEEKREQARQEVILLSSDPEYLELIARDRNDLHLPGETIYRIEREAPRRALELE